MTVESDRRFIGPHRCPVCGGAADDPQGNGVRCWGFLSDDGRFANCTRDEYASSLSPNGDGTTYAHLLVGACTCGEVHDVELRANRARMAGRVADRLAHDDDEAAAPDAEARPTGRTRYEIKDVNGTVVAIDGGQSQAY